MSASARLCMCFYVSVCMWFMFSNAILMSVSLISILWFPYFSGSPFPFSSNFSYPHMRIWSIFICLTFVCLVDENRMKTKRTNQIEKSDQFFVQHLWLHNTKTRKLFILFSASFFVEENSALCMSGLSVCGSLLDCS